MSDMLRLVSAARTFDPAVQPAPNAVTPPLRIVSLSGREALSTLYRYELELVSPIAEIDAAIVLSHAARIEFGPATAPERRVHGVITSFQFVKHDGVHAHYRAVLEPRVALLRCTRRSRVFQNRNLSQLVEDVLGADSQFSSLDYELAASLGNEPGHPSRALVVQYEEGDLDFLMRWLEHDGAFFYFKQGADREVMVIGESTASYLPAADADIPLVTFRSAAAPPSDVWEAQSTQDVARFEQHAFRPPATVTLRDYNPEQKDLITSSADISGGMGQVIETNNHYLSQETGDFLAGVRADEWRCRATRFCGGGNVRSLIPGYRVELRQFPRRASFNRKYVVVEVSVRATQDPSAGSTVGATFTNTFWAIGHDVPFRPARTTPWPRVTGSLHGIIGAKTDDGYSAVDDSGNYRIKLGIDNYAQTIPAIRRAQPYASSKGGFHMPLIEDTEVLVTHLNGNPDRPVLTGAVPNPRNPSPVTDANFTHHMFMSEGGSYIDVNDLNNDEIIVLGTGSYLAEAAEFLAPSYLLIGHTGSEVTTRVDYMAHNNSNLAYVGKEIVAGNDISMSAMKEFKVQVGFRPLLQLRIVLQAAWVKANATISKTKTGHSDMFMPAMIYAPLLNLVINLILSKINEAILTRMTRKAANPREVTAPQNPDNSKGVRKQLKRAGGALKSLALALFDTIKPNLEVLNPLAPGTVAERKEKPCFTVSRVSGPRVPGTQVSIANDGENILLFTEAGSFDVVAGEDAVIHADDVVRLRGDSVHGDAPGGSLHLTPDRAELLSGDGNARVAVLSSKVSGPLLPGTDRKSGDARDVRVGFRYGAAPAEKWNELVCDDEGVAVGAKAFGVAIGQKSALVMAEGAGATLSASDSDAAEHVSIMRGHTQITINDAGITIQTDADKKLELKLHGDMTLDAGGKNVTFSNIGNLKMAANAINLESAGELKLVAASVVDANGSKFQPVVTPPPALPAVPEVLAPVIAVPPVEAPVVPPVTSEAQSANEGVRRSNFKAMVVYWNTMNDGHLI